MNEIGLSSNMPSIGATRSYPSPRVDSGSDSPLTSPGVTPSTLDRGPSSTSPTQGPSSDTLSISSDAYRLQQTGAPTTETLDSRSYNGLDSEQAIALARTTRETMVLNPQLAFQAQASQMSARQVTNALGA
ncbi:hypothetical protein E6P07_02350 [Thermochromatium tepidum ATCC 43061]|uniref:Uncharacterized protein n=1 Tax=Thermochromatium tepidum ATCC 43061 TaxID=316276 RepID=A0A6I6DWR8_THETI|nr:hypothetical protein E6P07_02350 [Thermochromatium tepidum ATCC 43061]